MIESIMKKGTPDDQKKECFDCFWCQTTMISWWCINEKAINKRGTRIPSASNCEFWKSCKTINNLSWFERYFKLLIYFERKTS